MNLHEYLKGITYDRNLSSGVVEMSHGTQLIFDVRGWGWLTTHGGLSVQEAVDFQDEMGEFIVQATLEKLEREPQ